MRLSNYLHECGVESVKGILGKVYYVNMRIDIVVYFPRVKADIDYVSGINIEKQS